MKQLLTFAFLLFCFSAFAQEDQYQEDKLFPPEVLQSDFAVLAESLQDTHPSLYAFIEPDSLDQLIKTTKASLTEALTEEEFHIVVRKFLRNIRCGHTMAIPSADWYSLQINDSRVPPLDVVLLGEELFVKFAFEKGDALRPGSKIISINGIESAEIIRRMRAFHEVDGYNSTFEDSKIERSFTTYFLFLYGRSDYYEIRYLDEKSEVQLARLQGGVKRPKQTRDETAPEVSASMAGAKFYILEENLAYLDINRFSSEGFKKFYKTTFASIADAGIEHLVIDLRGNGGGYFPHGNRLLGYLLEDDFEMEFSRPKTSSKDLRHLNIPFSAKLTNGLFKLIPDREKDDPRRNYNINYKSISKNAYQGKIYVLIDGGSFSTSGIVAAKLKHHTEAIFIGQETGGGEVGSNAIIKYNLTLPETKVRVVLPYYFMDHNVSPELKGRGVFPDIEVEYSIEEILSGKDKEMEKVRALIQE
ncbi:MAG: S41 family peptidase [Bacteroidota bacterium]